MTPDREPYALVVGKSEIGAGRTVTAVATAYAFNESRPPEPELTVKADRPFLYVNRDRATGLSLFAGQVMDPRAEFNVAQERCRRLGHVSEGYALLRNRTDMWR